MLEEKQLRESFSNYGPTEVRPPSHRETAEIAPSRQELQYLGAYMPVG